MQNLRWNPSVHAVRRIKERCGIEEENAKNFVNQLMDNAKYITTNPNGTLVYKHDNRDLMIVVDAEKNVIVTLHSASQTETGAPSDISPTQPVSITVNRLASAIKREFERMQREVRREVRQLSEELALVNVEVATLNLNKIRCRAPHTQSVIQSRIDGLMAQAGELATMIDAKLTEVETAQSEIESLVGK